MDTPQRSKNNEITTSINKSEESPVFDFLNNLSPIKQAKSTHITQTINFASLPSVFTSPHANSLNECRFLRRHQLSDVSKPEFSSDHINVETSKKLDEQKENLDPRLSNGEIACEQSYEISKPFAESFNNDCNHLNSNLRPICALKAKEEASEKGLYGSEKNIVGINQIDQNKEDASCDWERLISDASDMLVFASPEDNDSYKNSIGPRTSFYGNMKNDMQSNSLGALVPSEHVGEVYELENLSTQPGVGSEMVKNDEINDLTAVPSINNPCEKMAFEHISGFYRGMRRRCLVYEMSGTRKNRLDEIAGSDTSLLLQSDGNTSLNDQQLLPKSTGTDTSSCVLPGIGLHLNALATTPKNYKIGNHETLASARLLIRTTSSVNFHPLPTGQELTDNTLAAALSIREINNFQNSVFPVENACDDASGYVVNEEISQTSPDKKRQRSEQGAEGESCKRCNCKKSKCLKLYCECFAAGLYCVEPCACIDCSNKPVHVDTVLATRKQIESRNPLAFAPKVINSIPETGNDSNKTPASARHKRGCNCKKSGCLKKYCECYQGGVGCSINCRCEGCKNTFGRKNGSCMEIEHEEDQADIDEKSVTDNILQNSTIQNDLEQNIYPISIATPLRAIGQSVQPAFSTNKKPPRSSSGQASSKPSLFQHPPKFNNHFDTIGEDEIPEFLTANSPISGVKSSSPNSKRISPPHGIGMSSGLRNSRKLILQSIPSFPSLGPNQ